MDKQSQSDDIEEIELREDQSEENTGLGMFSYIVHLRETIEKESRPQSKTFIDMEKFNNIIKQYCELLKDKKTIRKEDVLKIENEQSSQSQDQKKNDKSPDLAELFSNIFSPITKVVREAFVEKKPKETFNHETASAIKSNETQPHNKAISLETFFGISSSMHAVQKATKFKSHSLEPQSYKTDFNSESISDEDIFSIPRSFPPVEIKENLQIKDITAEGKAEQISHNNIEDTISIEEIVGLSSRYLPAEHLHFEISQEEKLAEENIQIQNEKTEVTDVEDSGYFEPNQKKVKESFIDKPFTISDLLGLTSTFSSADKIVDEGKENLEDIKNIPTDEPLLVDNKNDLSLNLSSINDMEKEDKTYFNDISMQPLNFDQDQKEGQNDIEGIDSHWLSSGVKESSSMKVPGSIHPLGVIQSGIEDITNSSFTVSKKPNFSEKVVVKDFGDRHETLNENAAYAYKLSISKEETSTSRKVHENPFEEESFLSNNPEEYINYNESTISKVEQTSEFSEETDINVSMKDIRSAAVTPKDENIILSHFLTEDSTFLAENDSKENENAEITKEMEYIYLGGTEIEGSGALETDLKQIISKEKKIGTASEKITKSHISEEEKELILQKIVIATDKKSFSTLETFEEGKISPSFLLEDEREESNMKDNILIDTHQNVIRKSESSIKTMEDNISLDASEIKDDFPEASTRQIPSEEETKFDKSNKENIILPIIPKKLYKQETIKNGENEEISYTTETLMEGTLGEGSNRKENLQNNESYNESSRDNSEEFQITVSSDVKQKEKKDSELTSVEAQILFEKHPTQMYLIQSKMKSQSEDFDSTEIFKEGMNKYSFEVMFMEEEKTHIDIDYPEAVTIDQQSQELVNKIDKSTESSLNSPVFYLKQNNLESSNADIAYKPMFGVDKTLKNPWYKKFEFFCVGKNVLMLLKKGKINE